MTIIDKMFGDDFIAISKTKLENLIETRLSALQLNAHTITTKDISITLVDGKYQLLVNNLQNNYDYIVCCEGPDSLLKSAIYPSSESRFLNKILISGISKLKSIKLI